MPKAAMRRLAADAGVKRCPAARCDKEARELVELVHAVVKRAVSVAASTGKKSVGRSHVQHALRVTGCPAVDTMHLSDSELRRMHRCNIKTSPESRKPSALSVEIPEATFRRVILSAMEEPQQRVRFTAAARRVLHATVEARVVRNFKGDDVPDDRSKSSSSSCPGVARTFGETTAQRLELLVQALDEITSMAGCTTVTVPHARSALEVALPSSMANSSSGSCQSSSHVLERAIRGRLPDRRFAQGVLPLLCTALTTNEETTP